LQRKIILNLVGLLHPKIVHTQTEPYHQMLNRNGIKTSLLPLFSTIWRVDTDAWDYLLEPMLSQASGKHEERSELYLAGIFGIIHPEWDVENTINMVFDLTRRFKKRLVVIFFGKSSLTPETFGELKSVMHNRVEFIMAGERTSFEISQILQSLDLGLSTTPLQIIQKSSSLAAMLEHGLPVLVTRDDWRLRGAHFELTEISPRLLSPKQLALMETLPTRDLQPPEDRSVKSIASQMLAAMQ
jgi:hypothetical protein